MKKRLTYLIFFWALNLLSQSAFCQDFTAVYEVDDISEFSTLTDEYEVVIYDGSSWRRKVGTITTNGGTLINVPTSPANSYYERSVPERRYLGKWFNLNATSTAAENYTALNALIAAAPSGATIVLPEGVIAIAGQVTVNKALTITGATSTTLTQATDYTTLFHVTANQVFFRDLTIQQTGKGHETNWPTGYGAGIIFYRVSGGGGVENCGFYNCGDAADAATLEGGSVIKSSAGVYVTGSSNIKTNNCRFYNSIAGVGIDDYQNVGVGNPARFFANNNDVSNSYFENCYYGIDTDFLSSGGGIDFKPGIYSNNTIIKKTIGLFAFKVSMPETLARLLISGNRVNGPFQEGIAIQKGSRFTQVINNEIDGCGNGITLFTSTAQVVRDILISGNTITNCTNAGVMMVAAWDSQLSGNKIYNNKRGVWINSSGGSTFSFNTELTDNLIQNNQYAGIVIDAAAGIKVTGGYIVNNSTDVANGYRSGIIINQPNLVGKVMGVRISNVKFDYTYSDGTTGATLGNQLYAIKTVGSYYSTNSNTPAGSVDNNYFGRCTKEESLSSGGIAYYRNQTATGIQDDVLDDNTLGASSPSTKLPPSQSSVKSYIDTGLSGKANTSHTHSMSAITDLKIYQGTVSPLGSVTATAGSIYQRTNGGGGYSVYVKESSNGSSDWNVVGDGMWAGSKSGTPTTTELPVSFRIRGFKDTSNGKYKLWVNDNGTVVQVKPDAADIAQDATRRFVSDTEKSTWNSAVSVGGLSSAFSGTGSTVTFNIAHGLGHVPTRIILTPSSADTGASNWYVSASDSTNVTITVVSSVSGTNNYRWYYDIR